MFWTYTFLLLVGFGLIGSICHFFYKSPYNIPKTCIFIVNIFFVRLMWRAQVPPELPVPRNQGVVLLSNHRSSVDPCFLQLTAQRVIHWLVAAEFGGSPGIKAFLRYLEVIEVRRSGQDTAATKRAIRLVQEGKAVGIFPEGRLNMSSDKFMMPIRPGAIIIALKGRVPIVPVYIEGSPYGGRALSPLFMSAKVTVRYGKPIDLSEYYETDDMRTALGEIAIRCAKEIANLAGKPDFEPTLAGRNWRPSDEEVSELNSQARRNWKNKGT